MQESRNNKQSRTSAKEDSTSKAKDMINQLALLVCMATITVQYFFGQGEEIIHGVGINKKIYYLAGHEDVGMWVLASVITTLAALGVTSILNKKDGK